VETGEHPCGHTTQECAGLLVATANTQRDGDGEGSTGVGVQLLSLSVKRSLAARS
jgi:hypothetical protein